MVSLRINTDAAAKLDAVAARMGAGKTAALEHMLNLAHDRMRELGLLAAPKP